MDKRIAVVTGGSRGIGRAICVKLAKNGFKIVFNYANGEDAAKETVKLCEEAGSSAIAIKADISEREECDTLIEKAMEYGDGRIDVLVNNAGITKDNLMMRLSDDDLDRVIDVNLKGTFYMMRGISRIMLKQKSGHIINMSSIVGLRGNAGQVNYSASKAAVIGMTKSLAKELASRKITVNAVAPGMIMTDMTEALSDAAKDAIIKSIPMQEIGKAEDVANLVAFLASEEASYITGQVLSIDGGMSI